MRGTKEMVPTQTLKEKTATNKKTLSRLTAKGTLVVSKT